MLLFVACTDPADPSPPPDRAAGDPTPVAQGCDPLDEARCWLPWPSSAHTVLDPSTPTGLRVAIDEAQLPVDDDPRWIELADGFSRLSPVLTSFAGELDPTSLEGAVRLVVAPSATEPAFEVPAWAEIAGDAARSLLIAYPADVLPPQREVVVAVTDQLRLVSGSVPPTEPLDAVALGRSPPADAEQEALVAWYAPVRAALADTGVDTARVLRAWSFPTRSEHDVGARAAAMIADVDEASLDGALSATIDEVEWRSGGSIAAVVTGSVTGVPAYREEDAAWLAWDEDGRPAALGTHAAPFRVVVPAGEGDYPVVLYGHGTGGDVRDSLFDAEISARGIAKAGVQFWGWNGDELLDEILYLNRVFDGTTRSTSALLQSVADAHAVLLALRGPLGDTLSDDTIAGQPNPLAGRRPRADDPIWVGGSLGGTMGAVIVAADPDIPAGVLNVPAGAWTHLIPRASLYTLLVDPLVHAWYPSDLDARAALAMSQNIWDDVDGAAWPDDGAVLLLQESIGDPVVPNVGTAMLARSRGAALVGDPLDDWVEGLEQTRGVVGRTGLTQYRSAFTEDYDIHGFAALEGPAGDAAREQIDAFLAAWVAGEPLPVVLPSSCDGGCDFGP